MNSPLQGEDKMSLIDIFAEIPDQNLEGIALLLEKDSSWIEKANENKKKKQEAFKTGNLVLWKQILSEERELLGTLTHDAD
jgi:hypothetical protein